MPTAIVRSNIKKANIGLVASETPELITQCLLKRRFNEDFRVPVVADEFRLQHIQDSGIEHDQ